MEDHPDAEKLYILKVDFGEDELRVAVMNIKSFYSPDKMLGRRSCFWSPISNPRTSAT